MKNLAFGLILAGFSAQAGDVIVLPPGTIFSAGYLENPVITSGDIVRVTLVPRMPGQVPFYYGRVVTSFVEDALEVRMIYQNCLDLGPCSALEMRTLEFPGPVVPAVYPVRIIYVWEYFPPHVEELAGTDTLTVLGAAEPIPTSSPWVLGGLALLLAGIGLRFLPRSR